MQTLDEAWTTFRTVTQATAHLIRTTPGYNSKHGRSVAAVAVVTAALRHATNGAPEGVVRIPDAISETLSTIRGSFAKPSPNVLLSSVDATFGWLRIESARGTVPPPLVDALSAVGWIGKAQLFALAGETQLAMEAGRNALDAVSRVLVLTGHSSDALRQLLVEEHRRGGGDVG
jgi:hypothetical protein